MKINYESGTVTYSWEYYYLVMEICNLTGGGLPLITLRNQGLYYKAIFTVTDTKGKSISASLDLVAGNDSRGKIVISREKNKTSIFWKR